jgi:hypothetical protein
MAKKAKVYTVDSPRSRGGTRKGTKSPDTQQPEFDTVESIRKTVENMQLIENERALDRALIDTLANGERPYSPEEVEEFQVQFNINWGELKKSVRDANAQINSALLFKPTLFTATSKGGPPEKRDEYSQKFTDRINKKLRKGKTGRKSKFLLKSRNASVTLHGPGVMYWPNGYCELPNFCPLENFLVPTDTLLDFSNCTYFNIKAELTPYQLYECTHGDKVDENWNMTQVNAILDGLEEMGTLNTNNYNWVQHPEKMQELFKQNRCYLNSDSVAKVKLDYFFSMENDGNWFLKIVLREGIGESDQDEFVYTSETPFADDLEKIIHVQFGDNSLVPPLKFHSVRGIGTDNYAPAWALNMFRSDLFQHGKEQMRMYLRIGANADKGRENMVNLMQYGIVEDGITFVPQSERHQIDVDLVDNIIAQCRQNVQENSSSYVQEIDNGTEKEQTLGEAKIRQQTANQNVSTLLTMMYEQETPFYEETVRRWLMKNPTQGSVIDIFQKECIADGIPPELMVADNWDIEPDKVLGAGDQSLALQQASALFQSRNAFDPKSQRIILRQFTSTLTQDPAKGNLLVPDTKDDSTSGAIAAAGFFGTLMEGGTVPLVQGITQTDYIATMLKSAGGVIQKIQSTDNMGTPQQVAGLAAVLDDAKLHIQIVASDPTQKMLVKQSMDAVGKLENELKGFAQRIAEQQKSSKGPNLSESIAIAFTDLNPDTQNAVLQSIGLPPSQMQNTNPKIDAANQKLQITQAKFTQQTEHKQISFYLDQIQKLTAAQADLSIEARAHNQEMIHNAVQKAQELIMGQQQHGQNMEQGQQTHDASLEQSQEPKEKPEKNGSPKLMKLDAANPAHVRLAAHFMGLVGHDKNKAVALAREHGLE